MKAFVDFVTAFDRWCQAEGATLEEFDAQGAMCDARELCTPSVLNWLARVGATVAELAYVTRDTLARPERRELGVGAAHRRSEAAIEQLAALLAEARAAFVPRPEAVTPEELVEAGVIDATVGEIVASGHVERSAARLRRRS